MQDITISDGAIVAGAFAFVGKVVWEFFTSGRDTAKKVDTRLDTVVASFKSEIKPLSDKLTALELQFTKSISESELKNRDYISNFVSQFERRSEEQMSTFSEKFDNRFEKFERKLAEDYARKQELEGIKQLINERIDSIARAFEDLRKATAHIEQDQSMFKESLRELTNRFSAKGF